MNIFDETRLPDGGENIAHKSRTPGTIAGESNKSQKKERKNLPSLSNSKWGRGGEQKENERKFLRPKK